MALVNPCTYSPGGTSCKTQKFIDNYGSGIVHLIANTGIFLPTIVSMVCLESGYGQSKLTVNGFNFGGIKYNSSKHDAFIEVDTTEYHNGSVVVVRQRFAKFRSVEQGLAGQMKVMMASRYRGARYNAKTPAEQIKLYVSMGYSTTPPDIYLKKANPIINACIDYKPIGRVGEINK